MLRAGTQSATWILRVKMPLLKYWTGGMPGQVRLTEPAINPKRVTSTAPYSTVPALTSQEKETKKLAVEQQKLQQKIKAAEKKAVDLENERSEEEFDSDSAEYSSESDEVSSEEASPPPRFTKAQLRAQAKLQELNSINRDLTKTASRTRVINRIKAEHNKRKQEALRERNANLKDMLAQKQAGTREAKTRRRQRRKKALVLQSDMNETRMQNIENVLQNVMKEQQKSKTAFKINNSSKSKSKKRKKASDSEHSDTETISSSSEDESEDSSDSEKKSKKRADKKQRGQKKKSNKKSFNESYNYGSIGNFIKSINK